MPELQLSNIFTEVWGDTSVNKNLQISNLFVEVWGDTTTLPSIYDEMGSGGIELNGTALDEVMLEIIVYDEISSGGIELNGETIYITISRSKFIPQIICC